MLIVERLCINKLQNEQRLNVFNNLRRLKKSSACAPGGTVRYILHRAAGYGNVIGCQSNTCPVER